jgi:hypothetical protein
MAEADDVGVVDDPLVADPLGTQGSIGDALMDALNVDPEEAGCLGDADLGHDESL